MLKIFPIKNINSSFVLKRLNFFLSETILEVFDSKVKLKVVVKNVKQLKLLKYNLMICMISFYLHQN